MRIFIIQNYYPSFLSDFYARHGEAATMPYRKQHALLMAEQFGTADFYSKNLALLGHTAEEFIINDERAQKQWAKEHGVAYSKGYFRGIPKLQNMFHSDWIEKIIEAQIAAFKPDVVYSHALRSLPVTSLRRIKQRGAVLAGQIAAPLPDETFLREFDVIFTSFPHFVERFRAQGIASEYFRLGFEETILPTLAKTEKQYDTVFIGSFGSKHTVGTELLDYLARETPIDLWGPGLEQLPADSPIRAHHHGEAWGHGMYEILHNAKIAVNRHIDIAENHANNMRLYEATGAGAMLLTDTKDNLAEFFEPGKEVETYQTKEELAEKIRYYLAHPDQRQKIAQAGQQRTLKDHTYKKRMEELTALLQKYVKK